MGASDPRPTQALTLPTDARILVVKLASLGDLLLATPALRALRLRYPQARLDVLTTPHAASVLRGGAFAHHIYILGGADAGGQGATAGGADARLRVAWASLTTLARLRATRYDAVAVLHHLTLPAGRLKHRALLAAVGARWSAGLDNGHGGFLDVQVTDQGFGARHEAEYFLAVAAALGAARQTSPGALAPARPELAQIGAPLIALHPGSGGYSVARRWPVARFAEVMRTLHDELGALFVVVGGAEEAALRLALLRALEYPEWAACLEDVSEVVGAADGWDVDQPRPAVDGCEVGNTQRAARQDALADPERWQVDDPRLLATTLRRCDLFIGGDSFPMHLAAAVGTPVVAIFGPTNHQAWGPYLGVGGGDSEAQAVERAVIVRRDDLACSPCLYRGHALGLREGCAPRPCLTALGTAPVVAAARRLLALRAGAQ